MKKLILNICAVVMTVLGLGGVAALSPATAMPAYAAKTGNDYIGSGNNSIKDGQETDLMKTIKTIINVVLGIVGVIAVVMMIVGGISFITSQGDTSKVTKARNTILYGVVGLVVALLAFAIVNFVVSDSGIFK